MHALRRRIRAVPGLCSFAVQHFPETNFNAHSKIQRKPNDLGSITSAFLGASAAALASLQVGCESAEGQGCLQLGRRSTRANGGGREPRARAWRGAQEPGLGTGLGLWTLRTLPWPQEQQAQGSLLGLLEKDEASCPSVC